MKSIFRLLLCLIIVSCIFTGHAQDTSYTDSTSQPHVTHTPVVPLPTPSSDSNTLTVVIGAGLALSETLSLIPAVKSNGIFQLIFNLLKCIVGG